MERLLTTSGNVSIRLSSDVVKTISSVCKLTSATAYRCSSNRMHLKVTVGAGVRTQGSEYGPGPDCSCTLTTDPKAFRPKAQDRATPNTTPINEYNHINL